MVRKSISVLFCCITHRFDLATGSTKQSPNYSFSWVSISLSPGNTHSAVSEIMWTGNKMGVQLNTCVVLGSFVRITKKLTERRKTSANVILTVRIWHHIFQVVISNIIWKFSEELWRNGKVIANVKFTWQTNGWMNGQTKRSLCIAFSSKGHHKNCTNEILSSKNNIVTIKNIVVYRVEGKNGQLVVRSPILWSNLLGFSVPAEKRIEIYCLQKNNRLYFN